MFYQDIMHCQTKLFIFLKDKQLGLKSPSSSNYY